MGPNNLLRIVTHYFTHGRRSSRQARQRGHLRQGRKHQHSVGWLCAVFTSWFTPFRSPLKSTQAGAEAGSRHPPAGSSAKPQLSGAGWLARRIRSRPGQPGQQQLLKQRQHADRRVTRAPHDHDRPLRRGTGAATSRTARFTVPGTPSVRSSGTRTLAQRNHWRAGTTEAAPPRRPAAPPARARATSPTPTVARRRHSVICVSARSRPRIPTLTAAGIVPSFPMRMTSVTL